MKVTTKWILLLSIPATIVFLPLGYWGTTCFFKGNTLEGIGVWICTIALLKVWTMHLRNPG